MNKKRLICCLTAATIMAGCFVGGRTVGAATEIYFEDNFENGSYDWETTKGTWSITDDGTKVLHQSSTSVEGRAIKGDKSWTDYSIQADVKVNNFNGSNRALLCGRFIDANNYYAVSLSSKNGGLVELRKKIDGKSSVVGKADVSISAGEWYNVELKMEGTSLKVYINNTLVIDATDTSLSNGAAALISSKVDVAYDNVKVSGNIKDETDSKDEEVETPKDEEGETPKDEVSDEVVDDNTSSDENSGTISLNEYSVTGFSKGNMGGGIIDETSPYYAKVSNATELAQALKKKSKIKVIEITNDIALGWNEIESSAKTAPITENITPLTHPTLKETGVSKVTVDSFDGLTIYSKNGVKLTHAGFVFKNCKDVVIRNIEFDELWEWDENTKGDYDRNDWDYLTFEGCSKVWVDHCTFNKAYDGIVDSKKGTTGLTISWSKFLPGDKNSEFYKAMFDEMEANTSNYPMYKYLRSLGLSKDNIMDVAAPHKKTHLVGAREFADDNADLEITLHHNYYKDSQDRMPRLRGGNAHIYNIVMDSRDANTAKSIITSSMTKKINDAGYHFGITSNGALSTEGGSLLLEKCQILGVSSPLRNNQKSASKSEYTGKILALDTIYEYKDISFRGNSTDKNSPLSPEPAKSIDFAWNGMTDLPYTYEMDEPETLLDRLTSEENGTGCGVLDLKSTEWMKTIY